MGAWFILLLWTLMSMLVGVGIGRWISSNKNSNPGDDMTKLNTLSGEIKDKARAEQLIKYHNGRVNAGADVKVSFERLVGDMKRLKEEEIDESGDS